MKKLYSALIVLLVCSMVLAACQQSATTEPAQNEAQATSVESSTSQEKPVTEDQLSDVLKRGYILISTDPAYPPQSELVTDARRESNTKCPGDAHTANEMAGFDISAAKEIANRLGVEACFTTPAWEMITSGNWANRWDISVGSMTITPDRMNNLYFSMPYYTTPAAFFVHKDNTSLTQPSDLSGKKIGACTGCTYDKYLQGILQIPGETINLVVTDPQFTGYETDTFALQDLALGDGVRLDAVLTAQPTGAGFMADDQPVKQLGDAVFFEYLAAAFDKASEKDVEPLVKKVSEIIQQMLSDGTLLKLSQEFYNTDLTTAAGKFDYDALNQFP